MVAVSLFCVLVLGFSSVIQVSANSNKQSLPLRVCVVGGPHQRTLRVVKDCDKLAGVKRTRATCVFAPDRLSCLRLVSLRRADFTLLEAEDLVFASTWPESNLLVVSEIRSIKDQPYTSGAVLMVRNTLNLTRIEDLRGTSLCHPGVSPDKLFDQYLEERVAAPRCDPSKPLYEDRLSTTSKFFGLACKAGPWVEDVLEDERLKQRYSGLCTLCDDRQACSGQDKYWGIGGAATCFRDGVGDVLWAKYPQIRPYFKGGEDDPANAEVSYMCEDGTLQPMGTQQPCLWMARPWQTVVAHPKALIEVEKVLEQLQSEDELTEWAANLVHVLEYYMKYIVSLQSSVPPEDYLRTIPGYLSAVTMSQPSCRPEHPMRWCVTSVPEQKKCTWIARAGDAFSIMHEMECVRKDSVKECYTALAQDEVDFVVIRPDLLPQAIRKYGLVTVVAEDTVPTQEYHLYPVVKKSSTIKRAADLRSRKACFASAEGLGWIAAMTALGSCSVPDLFKGLCVPSSEPQACCHARSQDQEANIFRCLIEDVCDVAFIDVNTLRRYTDGNSSEPWARDARSTDFRLICRGEKGSECHWAWALQGHVVMGVNATERRRREVTDALLRLGRTFGRSGKNAADRSDPAFEMFGPFNEETDVLFQDTTVGLVQQPKVVKPYPYEDIIRDADSCLSRGSLAFSVNALTLSITLLAAVR